MAEHLPGPRGPEHKITTETHGEHSSPEKTKASEKIQSGEKKHDVAEIQKSIEAQARSSKETRVAPQAEAESKPVIGQQRELKADAYQRTLRNVRPHLKPTERTFSRIIHQPTIETLSTVAAATAGRSSGLMGGGVLAFLGSAFVYFMGKYYGFTYNFTVFIVTFLGGFIIGILVEVLWRMLTSSKRQPSN